MTITFTFPGCWFHIDEAAPFAQSYFPDGRVVTSIPVPEKDMATARAYGYGENAFGLWREHDLLHHWVATQFGHPYSPTIWSVCHEDHPDALPHWARLEEEGLVGRVHRWLHLGEWHPEMEALTRRGADRDALEKDARDLLRRISSPPQMATNDVVMSG